jgi:phosphoglycolate phosphatase
LAELGIDKKVDANGIRGVAGNPYEKCIDILLPGLSQRYQDLLKTLEEHEYKILEFDGGRFFSGAVECVRSLAEETRVFLVSNCEARDLDLFLRFSGLSPQIAGFDCHGMSGLPKSEMLAKMKNKYSLNNPVYIGDTAGDEAASRQAGIEFVYVSWGFGELQRNVKTVDSFTELVDYLKEKT